MYIRVFAKHKSIFFPCLYSDSSLSKEKKKKKKVYYQYMMAEDSPMPFFLQSYTLEGYFHAVCNLDYIHKL